jgi:curved DNA-binding protein CbpA
MSMDEKVDLEPERKQEILDLEQKLGANNLFEFLGVSNGAPAEDVRAAFRELSRKFHPDRYFGKQLGSFKVRLDKIFKKLVEANQTLTDEAKRQAYLDANPFVRAAIRNSGLHQTAPIAAAPKTDDEKQRDDERRARLARHPYLLKTNKLQEFVSRAKDAIAKKEYSQAFTHLNQASQADPNNLEVKNLLAEVRKQNDVQRSEGSFKHGTEALARGDDNLALQAFKSAANGGHVLGAFKAATMLDAAEGDAREITALAQKAVDGEPKNVEYRLLLARSLEAAGMKAMAKKHFEEAARLEPDNPEVKKHVKKRWPF